MTTGSGQHGTLHHVELYVGDLERTNAFWGWLLPELGYRPHEEWDDGISWRRGATHLAFVQSPEPGEGFDRRTVGLNHVAFRVDGEREVDRLAEVLCERGARLLYEDRHPYAGGPGHYAAFLEDPDGLKVELVSDPQLRHEAPDASGTGPVRPGTA